LARGKGIPSEDAKECVEMFIVNAKFLSVLKPIAGAERIIPLEQVLEELPTTVSTPPREATEALASKTTAPALVQQEKEHNWDGICFYISPIGEEASTPNSCRSIPCITGRTGAGRIRAQGRARR
jgi:hypothetical protein